MYEFAGEDPEYFAEDMGLSIEELTEEADPNLVYDHWVCNPLRSQTPNGKAYHILDEYDLGPTSVILDELNLDLHLGYVSFIDGEGPGHDYLGVEVSSAPALSALQWNLTELESDIKIIIIMTA